MKPKQDSDPTRERSQLRESILTELDILERRLNVFPQDNHYAAELLASVRKIQSIIKEGKETYLINVPPIVAKIKQRVDQLETDKSRAK